MSTEVLLSLLDELVAAKLRIAELEATVSRALASFTEVVLDAGKAEARVKELEATERQLRATIAMQHDSLKDAVAVSWGDGGGSPGECSAPSELETRCQEEVLKERERCLREVAAVLGQESFEARDVLGAILDVSP